MPAIKTSSRKSSAPLKVAKTAVAQKPTAKRAIKSKAEDGVPLSAIIRRRIQAKKARFHANDNISQFIEPGDLEGLVDEVAVKMQAVLESLVIDTESDHNTRNTSQRVAKMFVNEVFIK
jgi:GTP cyclohydrolase I